MPSFRLLSLISEEGCPMLESVTLRGCKYCSNNRLLEQPLTFQQVLQGLWKTTECNGNCPCQSLHTVLKLMRAAPNLKALKMTTANSKEMLMRHLMKQIADTDPGLLDLYNFVLDYADDELIVTRKV